uniref:NADH-ubiquinone oxidoreductase chain 3 n=1 Tax=Bathysciadiidae sp. MNHN-IM-2013-40843 TaxID=2496596 RepID=A0A6B7FMQ5_9GAST|nr:NADH dehydrogenase subunit 3 [Bathysciadiidae sp. MNHN-IM-2013-40843]
MFMLLSLIIFFMSLTLSSVILLAAWLMSHPSTLSREKSSPFECGFDPMGNARTPLSMRFFLLAVIFLIFDIEIILLIPFLQLSSSMADPSSFMTVFLFLFILMFGLFHEWNEGSLNWF